MVPTVGAASALAARMVMAVMVKVYMVLTLSEVRTKVLTASIREWLSELCVGVQLMPEVR